MKYIVQSLINLKIAAFSPGAQATNSRRSKTGIFKIWQEESRIIQQKLPTQCVRIDFDKKCFLLWSRADKCQTKDWKLKIDHSSKNISIKILFVLCKLDLNSWPFD